MKLLESLKLRYQLFKLQRELDKELEEIVGVTLIMAVVGAALAGSTTAILYASYKEYLNPYVGYN